MEGPVVGVKDAARFIPADGVEVADEQEVELQRDSDPDGCDGSRDQAAVEERLSQKAEFSRKRRRPRRPAKGRVRGPRRR